MTDLQKLQKQLEGKKNESSQYFERKTLNTLIEIATCNSENLPENLYIPEYEVEKAYLFEVLETLSYSFEFEEEYNDYHEQMCYKIKLVAK